MRPEKKKGAGFYKYCTGFRVDTNIPNPIRAGRPCGLVGIPVTFWQPGHQLTFWQPGHWFESRRKVFLLTFVPGSGKRFIAEKLRE